MLRLSKEELKAVIKIAQYICSEERIPSSFHHRNVRRLIEQILDDYGTVYSQEFEKVLLIPTKGIIKVPWGETVRGIPYTNSLSGNIFGDAVDCGYGTSSEVLYKNLKNKIAVIKEGRKPFREKEKLLYRKGIKGIVVYHPEVDEIYNGIAAGLLPVISVKASAVDDIINKQIQIFAKTEQIKAKGKNIWIDFGSGEYTLTFIAHYDSKPGTKGAIDNALSVAVLLWLAKKVKDFKKELNYKVRILFTDLEEYGLEGAKRFIENLPERELLRTYAVAVDTIGWFNPAVLTADAGGRNSRLLLLIADKILDDLGIRNYFDFTEGKSGRSDHIPFKERGAKTLFLASNPFPFRHTVLDNETAIIPKYVVLWMKFLKVFALKFDKYLKEVKKI
jgi:aminopeptidase YwaD